MREKWWKTLLFYPDFPFPPLWAIAICKTKNNTNFFFFFFKLSYPNEVTVGSCAKQYLQSISSRAFLN